MSSTTPPDATDPEDGPADGPEGPNGSAGSTGTAGTAGTAEHGSSDRPTADGSSTAGIPQEVTLNDGDSITFTAPTDGTTHIVVNVAPPQRSTGFFSSCFQGCGCLLLIIVALSIVGAFAR